MQEVYENFNLMSDADFKAWMLNTDLLEKEELMIMRVYQDGLDNGYSNGNWKLAQYYEETFKTKER